jgi:membrane protease YdiL (CAAX protease family)
MAGPPLAFFFLPKVPGGRLRYQPLSEAGRGALLRRVLFEMPVGTAICEEVAFRGVLQALLRQRVGSAWSVLWSSLPFTLWHVAVNINTLRRTSLPRRPRVVAAALAGGLGSVFAGGLIFGALREVTGSLPAAIAAHWAVDAVMLLALFGRREAPAAAILALDVEEE